MQFLARLTLFLWIAAAAFGQHRGGFAGGGRGFGGGFVRGGGGFRGGFGHVGFGFSGHRGFFGGPFRFSSFGYWPYSYPIFVGGYWDGGYPYDYGYPYAYAGPSVQIISPYVPPPPPVASGPVVIEQHIQAAPPRSAMHEYSQTGERKPEPKAENKPALYLIALKNSVIYAAEASWVDGPTLHYVTLHHETREVPLSKVDRELTERLNRERNVPFRLPQ